jgi:hypothetical protein
MKFTHQLIDSLIRLHPPDMKRTVDGRGTAVPPQDCYSLGAIAAMLDLGHSTRIKEAFDGVPIFTNDLRIYLRGYADAAQETAQ